MRALLSLSCALVACQGETVGAATDAAVETSADVGVDAGCVSGTQNLVPNGDFRADLAGWQQSAMKADLAGEAGPCGPAIRFHDHGLYGTLSRGTPVTLGAGTKLRIRGWFRDRASAVGEPPHLLLQLYHPADGGAATTTSLNAKIPLRKDWTLVEGTLTVTRLETEIVLSVGTARVDGLLDDFLVSGLSVTAE